MAVSKTRSTCMVLCVGAGVAVYHQYRKRYFASMFTKCPRESYEIATRDLPPSDAAAISVVQFNILARNLATRERFPYVMENMLRWDDRKKILMRQLDQLDADIVCLQELTDYWTFFKYEFLARGYDSVFVKRPSVNISNWSGKTKQDGCGIFFKKDAFSLLECESINFKDDHDRVALFAKLKMAKSNRSVLVATTHIWWNFKKPEHQMAQVHELEEEIARLKAQHQGDELPVILCGDFNNSPSSVVYEYMQNRFLRSENEPMRSAYDCYQLCEDVETDKRPHLVDIETAPAGGAVYEPRFTTVNFRRRWTIDYIWFSTRHLRPTKLLVIPPEAELRSEEGPMDWLAATMGESDSGRLPCGLNGNHNGIPNSRQGSDHVPIMASLQLI